MGSFWNTKFIYHKERKQFHSSSRGKVEGVEPSSGLLLRREIQKGCRLFGQNVYQLVLGEWVVETAPMAFRAPSPGQCPCCSTGIAPSSTKLIGASYATQGRFRRQPLPMNMEKHDQLSWVEASGHLPLNKQMGMYWMYWTAPFKKHGKQFIQNGPFPNFIHGNSIQMGAISVSNQTITGDDQSWVLWNFPFQRSSWGSQPKKPQISFPICWEFFHKISR